MSKNNLQRNLKQRHITMMALGGTIGTGLLLASGSAIHMAGPGGALLGYGIVAILVYFLMSSLGEMSAHSPTTGSFCEYSAKYVDKAFGFAMSWNYWINWVLVIASEIIAAAIVMQFWFPDVSIWIWAISFFFLILLLNLMAVKFYGEAEYWMAFIKVSAVIIFIIVGTLTVFGLSGSEGSVGFKNITIGDAPFHAGFLGFLGVFLVAGYSFQGTELVGIAAGEAKNPQKSIPEAIKRVCWRIVIFYILAIAILCLLIPYTSEYLVNPDSKVSMSPFTIVFKSAGLTNAASLMNLVVITAIISAANASMYTASRILWYMGKSKEAPTVFQKLSTKGVPVVGVMISAAICGIFVMTSFFDSGLIFSWLINIISLAGYIAWFGICLSHYRFRKAYLKQGYLLADLPYKAKWFPFAPLFAMTLIIIIMLGQEVMAIIVGKATIWHFFATYSGTIGFITLCFAYKFFKRTKRISLSECDLSFKG